MPPQPAPAHPPGPLKAKDVFSLPILRLTEQSGFPSDLSTMGIATLSNVRSFCVPATRAPIVWRVTEKAIDAPGETVTVPT